MRFVPIAGPSRRIRSRREERPYTPYDNPYLALWLDCSDESTLTTRVEDGVEYVAEWRDKSGNNRHMTQDVASLQPRLIRVNGRVDGIQFHHQTGKLETAVFSLTNLTVVGVWQPVVSASNRSYVIGGAVSRYIETQPDFMRLAVTNAGVNFSFSLNDLEYYVQSVIRMGNFARAFTNGEESPSGEMDIGAGDFRIDGISNRSTNTGYGGRVREIIIRSVGNDRYRQQDEQYLLDKWGDRM